MFYEAPTERLTEMSERGRELFETLPAEGKEAVKTTVARLHDRWQVRLGRGGGGVEGEGSSGMVVLSGPPFHYLDKPDGAGRWAGTGVSCYPFDLSGKVSKVSFVSLEWDASHMSVRILRACNLLNVVNSWFLLRQHE